MIGAYVRYQLLKKRCIEIFNNEDNYNSNIKFKKPNYHNILLSSILTGYIYIYIYRLYIIEGDLAFITTTTTTTKTQSD